MDSGLAKDIEHAGQLGGMLKGSCDPLVFRQFGDGICRREHCADRAEQQPLKGVCSGRWEGATIPSTAPVLDQMNGAMAS